MSESLLKLCAHRALDGSKCKAPAVRQSDYCRHHARAHRPPVIFPAWVFEGSSPDELLAAVNRASDETLDGTLNPKFSGQVLHELAKRIHALSAQQKKEARRVRALNG